MPGSNEEPVHIVVQQIRDVSRDGFRVIAYRSRTKFHPLEFNSVARLVEALRSVLPGFDAGQIALDSPGQAESTIAWTGDVWLTDADLKAIGLRRIESQLLE